MTNYEETRIIGDIGITPKRDIVFKRIFGSKGNEGILKDFLESILDIKIDSLELDLATELLPEFYEGKKSRVDVRTKLSDGTEVNIEIQMDKSKFSEKRCLHYWSKIYSNNLREGGNYNDLRKTICIWILNDEVYKEFEDFQSKWKLKEIKHSVDNCFNELEIHIIELKKFRRLDIMKPGKKEFWLWFLDHTNGELIKMACDNNKRIDDARKQLNKIRADKELMERIRLQEAYEYDEKTSIVNARDEGKMAKQKEIAKKMLEKGMTVNLISEITGLSLEEIEKLKFTKK